MSYIPYVSRRRGRKEVREGEEGRRWGEEGEEGGGERRGEEGGEGRRGRKEVSMMYGSVQQSPVAMSLAPDQRCSANRCTEPLSQPSGMS